MKLKAGDPVEVAGDPTEPGWEGSWWTGVVVKPEKRGLVTVKYDEMLEEDGETKLVESVAAARVRPLADDDSLSLPLGRRWPGDAVDCWHEDGWWEGYVHKVYDDHITVYFSFTGEEYTDIYPPKKPAPDPEAHRVRTGWDWDAAAGAWRRRPKRSFLGAGNFRNVAPASAAVALAQRREAEAAAAAASSSSDDDEGGETLPARRGGHAAAAPSPAARQPAADAKHRGAAEAAVGASSSDGEVPLGGRTVGAAAVRKEPAKQPSTAPAPAAKTQQEQEAAPKAKGHPLPGPRLQQQSQPAAESQPRPAAAVEPQHARQGLPPAPVPSQAAAERQPRQQLEQQGHQPSRRQQQEQQGAAAAGQQQEAPPVDTLLKKRAAVAALLQEDDLLFQRLDAAAKKQRQDVQQPQQGQQQQGQQQEREQQRGPHQRQQQQETGAQRVLPAAPASKEGGAAAKQQPAAKRKGKGKDGDKLRRQALAGTAGRAGSLKAGKGGFVIPRRGDGGADGMLDSPRSAPSPRGGAAAARSAPAAASAAAASQPGAKRRRLDSQASTPRSATAAAAASAAQRGWEDAAAAAPPGRPRRGAIIPKVGQPMGAPAAHDRRFPTTFCLDNLPTCIDTPALREALEGLGFQGLRSVQVVTVPLDTGDRAGGYAVLEFGSAAAAQQHYDRLRSLCLLTPTCAVPRPLVLHEPGTRPGEYAWGLSPRLPGHLPTDFRPNQHFAQPNSIEFDLALDWRRAAGVAAAAKRALCLEQAAELAATLADAARAASDAHAQPANNGLPDSLLLPGEERRGSPGGAAKPAAASNGGSGGQAGWPPSTCCVWLGGVPCAVGQEELKEAFSQFGFPQQAHIVLDPVTRRPSGHAVLWMESPERAAALVQNLRDMVYMLNGTPRAVEASLTLPGPPRGSQSTYDRALRAVFGADDSALQGDVRFVEVRDELALQPGAKPWELAVVALRRMLHAHRKEQAGLKAEKLRRFAELDAQHQRQLSDERIKLGRLAGLQLAPGPDGKEPLLSYLMQRHGMRGKLYKNKDAAALARTAAAMQAARSAAARAGAGASGRPALR